MSIVFTANEGPLAVVAQTDDRTLVYSGENTAEAKRQANQSGDMARLSEAWAHGATAPDNLGSKSAKTWAEDSRTSAGIAEAFTGPTLADIAEGLAATVDGEYFAVSAADVVTIYLNAEGSALAQRTMATTSALASKSPVLGLALIGRPSVADLLALTETSPAPGDLLYADRFSYRVAPEGTTTPHVTTAGGLDLLVEPIDGYHPIEAFGVKGDGSDETAAIQAAIDTGLNLSFPAGTFGIDQIVFESDNANYRFAGSCTFLAQENTEMFRVMADGVTFDGSPLFACQGIAHCALRVNGADFVCASAQLRTRDVAIHETKTAAGFIFAGANSLCGDIFVDSIANQTSNQTVYVALWGSNNTIGDVEGIGGDIAVSLYGSINARVGFVRPVGIADNALYYNGTATGGRVAGVLADDFEEGIVLDSSAPDADLIIGVVGLTQASNKGVSLRQGRGYVIQNYYGKDAPISQGSAFDGQGAGLTVGSATIHMTEDKTAVNPRVTNEALIFDTLTVIHEYAGTSKIIDLIGTASFQVGQLNVIATNAAIGLNYTRSSGPVSPTIFIGNYKMSGTVEEFGVSYANSASFSIGAATHRGNHTIQNSSAPTLRLESLKPSMGSGEEAGAFAIRTSDTSGTGPRDVFRFRTYASNSNASQYTTQFLDDEGNLVGTILSGGGGMSFKLPTSANGLAPGMIWNNGGFPAIV